MNQIISSHIAVTIYLYIFVTRSYGDASAPASAPLMTKWANDNLKGDDLKAAPQVIAALAPIVDGTAN